MIIKRLKNKRGQGLTEYIILVALVAVASLGVVEVLNSTLTHKLAVITAKLQGKKKIDFEAPETVREKHYRKRTLGDFWKTNQ
jgi:pilus assembly protein Flp/PilA